MKYTVPQRGRKNNQGEKNKQKERRKGRKCKEEEYKENQVEVIEIELVRKQPIHLMTKILQRNCKRLRARHERSLAPIE